MNDTAPTAARAFILSAAKDLAAVARLREQRAPQQMTPVEASAPPPVPTVRSRLCTGGDWGEGRRGAIAGNVATLQQIARRGGDPPARKGS
jgi:hypothetical protein